MHLFQFDSKKKGQAEISNIDRAKLDTDLNIFKYTIFTKTIKLREKKKGYLTITIGAAVADSLLSGDPCDSSDKCDSFVKVLVNCEHVFETKVIANEKYATFEQKFTTEKIYIDSIVTLELYDYDTAYFPLETKQLIFSWDVNVKKLLETSEFVGTGSNKISVTASWQDE